MKTYRVIEPLVTIGAGEELLLSDEQATRRKLNIERCEAKGVYRLTKPMQFKKGEEFGCDFKHNPPRTVTVALEEIKAKPKAAKK